SAPAMRYVRNIRSMMTATPRWLRQAALIALLCLAFAPAPAQANDSYADGLKAYDRGDFKGAFDIWLPLAQKGNATAQHGVALLYELGRGVAKSDDKEAAKWYAAAAKQGVPDSQANLALMYAEGRGVDQDYTKAADLWQQAATH